MGGGWKSSCTVVQFLCFYLASLDVCIHPLLNPPLTSMYNRGLKCTVLFVIERIITLFIVIMSVIMYVE